MEAFVGAERQVDDHQRTPGAAHHRVALQDHHVERDGHRAFEPVHHHAERVPDQDDIAIAVEDARGMRVIRGQANERLAALAGANVGRGQPTALLMHRHASRTNDQCPKAGVALRTDGDPTLRVSRISSPKSTV